jgi:hypothetical protein
MVSILADSDRVVGLVDFVVYCSLFVSKLGSLYQWQGRSVVFVISLSVVAEAEGVAGVEMVELVVVSRKMTMTAKAATMVMDLR